MNSDKVILTGTWKTAVVFVVKLPFCVCVLFWHTCRQVKQVCVNTPLLTCLWTRQIFSFGTAAALAATLISSVSVVALLSLTSRTDKLVLLELWCNSFSQKIPGFVINIKLDEANYFQCHQRTADWNQQQNSWFILRECWKCQRLGISRVFVSSSAAMSAWIA